MSRGLRNFNPGNIRISKEKWQGLAQTQKDKEFFTFESSKWGIRAMARVLITYQDKHGCDTIRKFISRWAPASENNTLAYVNSVSKYTGFAPDTAINVHEYTSLKPLINAIIFHENGSNPYTDTEIDAGLVLAGVVSKPKPLGETRTVKGGKVATGATIGSIIAGYLDQIKESLGYLAPYTKWAGIALGAVALLGVGYMVWARIDDRNKGLR